MAIYILVAGAWHSSWCWERVVPLLEPHGHVVITPNLAGMDPADRTPLSDVTLEVWAEQIAALVREQSEPVILVGHSRAGLVISEVAERVPERIATLVYLAAFLVPSGETLSSTLARLPREHAPDYLIVREDGTTIVRPEAVEGSFYHMTDPFWVERARSLLTAEPLAIFATPLRLSASAYGSVKRVYIECTQDKAVPLELQRLMQAALPCAQVYSLETDHSPFYSAPDRLVQYLQRI